MKSLESDKVCSSLTVEQRMFVCQKDREKDPGRLNTARCMMDIHSGRYLKAELCEHYEVKK